MSVFNKHAPKMGKLPFAYMKIFAIPNCLYSGANVKSRTQNQLTYHFSTQIIFSKTNTPTSTMCSLSAVHNLFSIDFQNDCLEFFNMKTRKASSFIKNKFEKRGKMPQALFSGQQVNIGLILFLKSLNKMKRVNLSLLLQSIIFTTQRWTFIIQTV